ncbi:unnamed protein product [Cylicocyclus nassatus]|uniref:Ig-like domain-containing protein n=1 Tax=Cylicocyclus nassatus TaxID=53992 RepID=A0AA36GTC4_CYLNA|nr:unnamed protein product [Cylicocyclus nassatus]
MISGCFPHVPFSLFSAGSTPLLYFLIWFLLGAFGNTLSPPIQRSSSPVLEFSSNPCPVVPGCQCIDGNVTRVECRYIGPKAITLLAEQYPSVRFLHIAEWTEDSINLDDFYPLQFLSELYIIEGEAQSIHLALPLRSITHLDLSKNSFEEFKEICNITRNLPALVHLSLNENHFTYLPPCVQNVAARTLNLSSNQINFINGTFHRYVRNLDLSGNTLTSTSGLHGDLLRLNLSHNPLVEAAFPRFKALQQLDLSDVRLQISPDLDAPKLAVLFLDQTSMEVVDFTRWNTPNLQRMTMDDSIPLKFVSGHLPASTKELSITNTQLVALPQSFFEKSSLRVLNLTGSNYDCDPCVFQWSLPVARLLSNQTQCAPIVQLENCTLGISQHNPEIVRTLFGQSPVLPCTVYGSPQPAVEWWLYRPATYLGKFDPEDVQPLSTNSCCTVLNGGALLLHDVNRSFIERYVCVARQGSESVSRIFRFRLDYSSWYSLDLFNSVFWGGIATAVLVCSFSFLLNITWILTRKSILWWIQRAERLSRVRKMVEAMEKYRARQMEGLHDKYTKKLQLVRENYHAQVEALRLSYSSQAEKFRGYRVAQMEQMSSHLENIRENYNQQMQRVREYGSRRAEQLWESYERQVNRMKAFSLQHRLKMMRQYKVKQRYLNKLLESLQDSTASPETLRKHEEEVRAALQLPDTPPPGSPDDHPLSRSSSFYSLPEYVIDDDGTLRPSPLMGTVRFIASNARNRSSTANKGAIKNIGDDEPGTSTSNKREGNGE